MSQAKNGDVVKIHYTGKLDDGKVFDTSAERDPLEFTIGQHQVIPGFEDGIIGMAAGESRTLNIESANAYGPYRPEMIVKVARGEFPEDFKPEKGQFLQLQQEDGQMVMVEVTDLSDAEITLDGNHPLAGKDLTFEIRLVEIVK